MIMELQADFVKVYSIQKRVRCAREKACVNFNLFTPWVKLNVCARNNEVSAEDVLIVGLNSS